MKHTQKSPFRGGVLFCITSLDMYVVGACNFVVSMYYSVHVLCALGFEGEVIHYGGSSQENLSSSQKPLRLFELS